MAIDNVPIQRTLFIDPGLEGTGWAFFSRKYGPDDSGVIRPIVKDWKARSIAIANELESRFACNHGVHIGLEFPEMWGSSSRSHASSTDLFELAFLCGVIYHRITCHSWHFFTVKQWKGQLPKKVVIKRIQKAWGIVPPNHAADAVGMGLAAQGLL